MLKAFKARLRAHVCLHATPEQERQVIATFWRMIYRLVKPATFAARKIGCPCIGHNQTSNTCPYHGLEARRVIHG